MMVYLTVLFVSWGATGVLACLWTCSHLIMCATFQLPICA